MQNPGLTHKSRYRSMRTQIRPQSLTSRLTALSDAMLNRIAIDFGQTVAAQKSIGIKVDEDTRDATVRRIVEYMRSYNMRWADIIARYNIQS